MLPMLGELQPVLADERPDLLAEPVRAALEQWQHATQVGVVEIDPALADTAAMTSAYGVALSSSANCVVVMGRRGGEERMAACVVRADQRVDVNNAVKRLLDVRKASFLPMERAVGETAMEYGGITPVGLPGGWRLLITAEVLQRFRLRAVPGHTVEPEPSVTLRPKGGLPMLVEPLHPRA